MKPVVVKFNPWRWSGQDKLLEAFFDEIGAAFRTDRFDDKMTAKRLARFWEGLKVVTLAGGELATRMQEALIAAAALLAGGSGVVSSYVTNPTGKAVLGSVSLALLGVAGVCAVYAPFAEKLAAVFDWKTKKDRLSLNEVRGNLLRELGKLEAPLLVVIDDIDRLTKREIRLLVQLVKANADFPNVVYLLLYQKNVLAEALDEVASEKGQDFLKKIVQVELEMPLVPNHEMLRFFRDQIGPVLKRVETRWEDERWGEVFEEGVWRYFRTPRDIKRFRGVLEFYMEAHVEDGVLEVNPIDIILLETLRMFDPTAYGAVGRAFQQQHDVFLEVMFHDEETKARLNLGTKALLERKELTEPEKQRLQVLLNGLFPQANEQFKMTDELDREWERHLRICHPKFFPRYFQLGGEPGAISAAFVATLFKAADDIEKLRELLQEAFDKKPFTAVMERLVAVLPDVPQSTVEPLITALFDLSDRLPELRADILTTNAEHQLGRLAALLLRRVDNQSERAAAFHRAVLASKGIAGPVFCFFLFKPTNEDQQMRQSTLMSAQDLNNIQAELLRKLWSVARSGRLWKMPAASVLFHTLCKWAGDGEVRQWLTEALRESETSMAFLRTTLNQTWSSGGRGTRTVYTLLGKHVELFVELAKLADTAEPAAKDELEKAALEKLHLAIRLKTEGKPYDQIYVLSRDESGRLISDPHDDPT
jgi:predicted KAP-like P-loop ATPase